MLLPVNIRQKILGDERDVEITGANDHIRVVAEGVSKVSWEQFNAELPELLDMIAKLETQE
jgi:MraZ protein